MSRVERSDDRNERREAQQPRQAQRGRGADTPREKPSKAEGELGDVEEALRHQSE